MRVKLKARRYGEVAQPRSSDDRPCEEAGASPHSCEHAPHLCTSTFIAGQHCISLPLYRRDQYQLDALDSDEEEGASTIGQDGPPAMEGLGNVASMEPRRADPWMTHVASALEGAPQLLCPAKKGDCLVLENGKRARLSGPPEGGRCPGKPPLAGGPRRRRPSHQVCDVEPQEMSSAISHSVEGSAKGFAARRGHGCLVDAATASSSDLGTPLHSDLSTQTLPPVVEDCLSAPAVQRYSFRSLDEGNGQTLMKLRDRTPPQASRGPCRPPPSPRQCTEAASGSTACSDDLSVSWGSEEAVVYGPEARFTRIRRNIYIHGRKYVDNEKSLCMCNPALGHTCSEGDGCLNRSCFYECHPGYCPCGDRCTNNKIQRGVFPKTRVEFLGAKGYGLVAAQDIAAGTYVEEYLGEVMTIKEGQDRSAAYHAAGQLHTYIMNLSGTEVVDATQKGGVARFINHSCSPNCEVQNWTVRGEKRLCVFTRMDVKEGEELTYNYKMTCQGDRRTKCHCGAPNCAGFLESLSRVARGSHKEPFPPIADPLEIAVDNLDGFDTDNDHE